MGKGLIAGAVIAIVLIAGGLWLYSAMPQAQVGQVMTGKLGITVMDTLAGSQDATTTDVYIYRMIGGNLVQQEQVDVDAASKDTSLTYTTAEQLYFKIIDPTDTSLCTQYAKFTVPFASHSEVENGVFEINIQCIDRGDVAISASAAFLNSTAVSGVTDASSEGWTSAVTTWEFKLRQPTSEKGYINSYNFLKGYDNNHYFYMDISGTGWDSVIISGPAVGTFTRNNHKYFVFALDNDDLTRDLQSDGNYDPIGTWTKQITWDFSGLDSGDNVTLAYGYRYYASWDYFKSDGSWGADSASSAGTTIYVQY
jgi:hypothetical protein